VDIGDCPCRGLAGLELASCLAPPPGDYEVVLEGLAGSVLVLNEEGVWLRRLVRDEWLPFLAAQERRAGEAAVRAVLGLHGMSVESLVCEAARALDRAARGGSLRAREKLAKCRGLVEELCGEERGR